MSPKKAFASAIQEIGTAGAIKTEFLKTENPRPKHIWERRLAAAITLGLIIPLDASALCKNDLSPAWRLLGFANLACIVLAVFGYQYLNRMFPVVANRRIRTAIGLAFGFVSMAGIIIFMNFILPKFEMTPDQLTVVVLWSMTLMAALGTVWAGLEEAARRQTAPSRS